MFTDSPQKGRFEWIPGGGTSRLCNPVEFGSQECGYGGWAVVRLWLAPLDDGHKRKVSSSRVIALVVRYTTGYFVTSRRNPSRSSVLSRARTGRPGPTLSRDLACRTVQYPPSATSI